MTLNNVLGGGVQMTSVALPIWALVLVICGLCGQVVAWCGGDVVVVVGKFTLH